jgi:hypothetical protein
MAAKPERNRKMAIAVLRGYNYTQVAKIFSLSQHYVRITVLSTLCRALGYDKPFHKRIGRFYSDTYTFPLTLEEIRAKHKYRLIERLTEQGELNGTLSRRLKEISDAIHSGKKESLGTNDWLEAVGDCTHHHDSYACNEFRNKTDLCSPLYCPLVLNYKGY